MTPHPFPKPPGPLRQPTTASRAPGRLRNALSLLVGGMALAAAAQTPDPQAMLSAGQTAQALQWLDEQSSLSPWDTRLVAQRAMLLSLLHRDQQALRLLDDMASRNPAEPATYNLMALIHIGSGDYESARTAAQRALRANVGYVPALKTLAEIEMRLARQYYDHAARVDRGADPTLARRAAALTEVIGKPASAFAQPGALLTLAPALQAGVQRLTQAPSAAADGALSITLSQPPEQTAAAASGRPSKGQSMIALGAVPAAPAGVLISPPGGVAPVSAAGTAHPHEGSATTTFAALAGGTAPAGFFGNSRLTAVAPAPIGALPPTPTVRITPPPAAVAVATAPLAATPLPAVPPAPAAERPPAAATTAQQAEVDAALRRWTAAWSRRDVAGYLAAYDDGFSGRFNSANGGRAAWERERTERIGGRSGITVELSEVAIRVDGDHAETRFRQRYQSGPLTSVDIKTLHWQRGPGGNWVITREIVGG